MRRVGGVTGLMAIGFVLLAVIVRDWPIAVMLVVVFACIALGQVAARSRARRRMSEARLSGRQRWRGRVIREGTSLFDGRVWWTAFNDGVPADLVVGLEALVLEPTRGGRKWGHLQDVRVPWTDVVGARTRDLSRETPEGTVSFVPLTEVTLLIVGDLVPTMRPDEWLAEEELTVSERAEVDEDIASFLAAIRETVGDDYVFGVLPLVFLTPDASGLADATKARARGSLPSE